MPINPLQYDEDGIQIVRTISCAIFEQYFVDFPSGKPCRVIEDDSNNERNARQDSCAKSHVVRDLSK